MSRPARGVLLVVLGLLTGLLVGLAPATATAATHPGRDGRIAFVRDGDVYTMTRWGGDVVRLTRSGVNQHPAWSPDGRRIAYLHQGAQGRTDVWVMGAWGRRPQPVTRSGDVAAEGVTWSPDGLRLAFAAPAPGDPTVPVLQIVRAVAPPGGAEVQAGYLTGSDWCSETPPGPAAPFAVDGSLNWSPDGTRIAVFQNGDCRFDDTMSWYFPQTGELRQVEASGADCCGYRTWTDLFWGPEGQFGYTEQDRGEYGEDVDAPTRVVYPGFATLDGDSDGAPSPSGTYLALTNASSGTPEVVRALADGTQRRTLTVGHQPDWQPRP